MKWFWSFMVVLVIATGVLLARRGTEHAASPSPELIATEEPAVVAPVVMVAKETEPEVAPVAPPVAEAPAPVVPEVSKEIWVPEVASGEPVAGAPGSVEVTSAESVTKIKPVAEVAPQMDAAPPAAPIATAEETQPVAGAQGSEEPKPALFRDQFEIVPARVKAGENGFTIYDERFPVKGAGTAEDPMVISWEFLVSASETFQPRMGKKRLPERITMLDGKHVRVTGYVAFPIMAASQNEMLSMRNMWDGCCIGVPPTPYDALEVKLKGAATGRDRFTAFGTVEGKMQVDPYIKGNWLLGLYLMEGATLSQLKEGGDPGKHGGM